MGRDQTVAGAGRTKFKFPPVNEVVIGIRFPPIAELKAQHIGLYWDVIRERFPISDQQFPFPQVVEAAVTHLVQTAANEIFPLARFLFLSSEHPLLIQVQRDAFWVNWRRGSRTDDYPQFEAVEASFWQEVKVYKAFIESIGGKLDVVSRCELTYVNLIGPNSLFSTSADLGKVVPSVAAFTGTPGDSMKLVGLNASATHQVNENLFIDSSTRLGTRNDTKELVVALELRAYGAPDGLSLEGVELWLKSAHDSTYRVFLALTDKEIQEQIWKPQ